jgi:hypothetical protein
LCPDSPPNPEDVWSDYEAVLHFNSPANRLLDSTGNHVPSMSASGVSYPSGVEGDAVLLSNGQISLPGLEGTLFPQDEATVELWLADDSDFSGSRSLFGDCLGTGFCLRNADNAPTALRAQALDTDAVVGLAQSDINDAHDFHMAAGLVDVAAQQVGLYIGGGFPPLVFDGTGQGWAPSAQVARIGNGWSGALDEVRIANVVRDEPWLHATWLSLTDRFVIEGVPPVPPAEPVRVDSRVPGVVVQYAFDEGAAGPWQRTGAFDDGRLALNIASGAANPAALTGALQLYQATMLESDGSHGDLNITCTGTTGVTLEVWISLDNLLLDGPARIFSYGRNAAVHNFMLGQAVSGGVPGFEIRLRTDMTSTSGEGGTNWFPLPSSVQPGQLLHVVAVWSTNGSSSTMTAYLNGEPQLETGWLGGQLDWQGTNLDALRVGNERIDARPWLGTIYGAALYCEALDALDVDDNFNAALP